MRSLRSLSSIVSARRRVSMGASPGSGSGPAGRVGANLGASPDPPEMHSASGRFHGGCQGHGLTTSSYGDALDEPDSPSSTCTSHTVIAPTSTPPIAEIPFSVEPSEDVIAAGSECARAIGLGWTPPAAVSPLGGYVSCDAMRYDRWLRRIKDASVPPRTVTHPRRTRCPKMALT